MVVISPLCKTEGIFTLANDFFISYEWQNIFKRQLKINLCDIWEAYYKLPANRCACDNKEK